ncbi:TLDc domain-containing protein [Entamoeba marina]
MSCSFADLKKLIDTLNASLKKTEKEVNSDEVEETKKLVEKYDVILEGDVEEKELVLKYETFYDELNKSVLNKRNETVVVENDIKKLSEFINVGKFTTVLNKKKDNTNQIIDCINRIVDRIKLLETTVYNNRIKELDNMKVERYDVDLEMDIINNSMNILKEWSNKNTSNIIFDSKVDGNGSNNVLHNRVMNRSNMYFIHFDENNNVYGGYLNTKVNNSYDYSDKYECYDIHDKNAFVFSLTRNAQLFFLHNKRKDGLLYYFGNDVRVHKVDGKESFCKGADSEYYWYNYGNVNKPFTDITHPNEFAVQRIVVLQMN